LNSFPILKENNRKRKGLKRRKLKRPRLRFENYESNYLAIVVAYVIADILVFSQFSLYIREPVISQISGILLTVEGVLIGLTPQIKYKKLRNIVALLGMVAMLISVGTFATSTYQAIQLNYLSFVPTTILFQATASLFLAFVEVYALAILLPFTPKDPDKNARKKIAEAW